MARPLLELSRPVCVAFKKIVKKGDANSVEEGGNVRVDNTQNQTF